MNASRPGRSAPRVAVICSDRGIPWLGRGGASAHLQGIAEGYAACGAVVEAWVRTLNPSLGAPIESPPGVRALMGPADGFARWVAARARDFQPTLVHERHVLGGGVGGGAHARWLLEVNAPLVWEEALFRGGRMTKGRLSREQAAFDAPDVVIAVSSSLAGWIRRRDVQIVPNGVARIPARTQRTLDGPYVLGFEGTFKSWHGLREAIPGLAQLQQAVRRPLRIELAGDGPLRLSVLSALSACPYEVHWLGSLTASELQEARSRWHAAWSPQAEWPPPGSEVLSARAGENVPARWFAPLKEVEAAAAGLSVWQGGHFVEPSGLPQTWADIAANLLEDGGPVSRAVDPWDDGHRS